MKKRHLITGVLLITATAAFAHQGVMNKAVKARMDGMSAIAKNVKTIGLMVKGTTDFDAVAARAAAAAIADHAAAAPGLFEPQETDPKTEAKPEIWENFGDFTAKAEALETLARALSVSIDTPDDLGPAMRQLGESCKSCHSVYRETK